MPKSNPGLVSFPECRQRARRAAPAVGGLPSTAKSVAARMGRSVSRGAILIGVLSIVVLTPCAVHSGGRAGQVDRQKPSTGREETDLVIPPDDARTRPSVIAGPVETRRIYEIS